MSIHTKNKNNLKILMASPEVVPYAKTGGLADVAGALSQALSKNNEVVVVMPLYKEVRKKNIELEETGKAIEVPIHNRIERAEIKKHKINNVITYFIECDKYYDRDELYTTSEGDFQDNAERFSFFCKAVIKMIKSIDYKPDIIHCHDWQTGLIPVYVHDDKKKGDPFFKDTKVIFTIHNLAYQGTFWHFDMYLTGLSWDYFTPDGIEFYGKINFLKAGIMFSNKITTVSPKYAQEIQTEEFGHGLEGVLRYRKNDLVGILNGVDYQEWSPENDIYIKKKYDIKNIEGKQICKEDLIEIFNLQIKPTSPIIGSVTRIAEQKGIDIFCEAIPQIIEMGIGIVVLGKGDKEYEQKLLSLQDKFKGKIGVKIGFDNALAHKIEAGADMFLMPSKYEPCGLNQMYSLKYGTVPIVRATGGLDDTIKNFSPTTGKGNGFKFKNYSSKDLVAKVKKALTIYKNKRQWMKLVKNGMQEDFSWDVSAKKYEALYKLALKKSE